jgi:hypothetical protein
MGLRALGRELGKAAIKSHSIMEVSNFYVFRWDNFFAFAINKAPDSVSFACGQAFAEGAYGIVISLDNNLAALGDKAAFA